MDKKVRLVMSTALGVALLSGLLGLVGCSGDATLAEKKEIGGKSRDERQKSREFGGQTDKAVPQKGRGR